MKFQKIDDNSIRCIISQEEMAESGIEIEDLMDHRDKAEGFLRKVLKEARSAVDFKADGSVINVQMSVMPSGDVSLMITDDANAAIRNILNEIKERMKDGATDSEILKAWVPKEFHDTDVAEKNKKPLDLSLDKAEDKVSDMKLWAEFNSLSNAISCAGKLPDIVNAPSSLYQFHDSFFMEIRLKVNKKDFAGVAFRVAEYADDIYAETPVAMEIKEHGKVVIKDHAVSVLSSVSQW